jgi:hypothetical protein
MRRAQAIILKLAQIDYRSIAVRKAGHCKMCFPDSAKTLGILNRAKDSAFRPLMLLKFGFGTPVYIGIGLQ